MLHLIPMECFGFVENFDISTEFWNDFLKVTSPSMTEVEQKVMDWLGKMLGLPKEFLFEGGGGGAINGLFYFL